jgi:hypothetical protein
MPTSIETGGVERRVERVLVVGELRERVRVLELLRLRLEVGERAARRRRQRQRDECGEQRSHRIHGSVLLRGARL